LIFPTISLLLTLQAPFSAHACRGKAHKGLKRNFMGGAKNGMERCEKLAKAC